MPLDAVRYGDSVTVPVISTDTQFARPTTGAHGDRNSISERVSADVTALVTVI